MSTNSNLFPLLDLPPEARKSIYDFHVEKCWKVQDITTISPSVHLDFLLVTRGEETYKVSGTSYARRLEWLLKRCAPTSGHVSSPSAS